MTALPENEKKWLLRSPQTRLYWRRGSKLHFSDKRDAELFDYESAKFLADAYGLEIEEVGDDDE